MVQMNDFFVQSLQHYPNENVRVCIKLHFYNCDTWLNQAHFINFIAEISGKRFHNHTNKSLLHRMPGIQKVKTKKYNAFEVDFDWNSS